MTKTSDEYEDDDEGAYHLDEAEDAPGALRHPSPPTRLAERQKSRVKRDARDAASPPSAPTSSRR